MIIDLGGGTFDNTILVRDGDFLEVKATNGDTHLGGADFDNNVVEYCRQQFIRDTDMDIINDAKAMRKLKTQVEKIKCVLSTANSAEINVDALHDGEDFSMQLTRQKFEQINEASFNKIVPCIEQCLANAKLKKEEINDVVLVGGSTRIPKVRELV